MIDSISSALASSYEIIQPDKPSAFVLVCEHASNSFPPELKGLGLSAEAQKSHIAWDIGGLNLANSLADNLSATLIVATQSRLIYDCNRAPDDTSAMPARSETFDVPGNVELSDNEKNRRIREVYQPFHQAIEDTLASHITRGTAPVLISVHSFTPVYFGKTRAEEIGLVFEQDNHLASAMLAQPKSENHLKVEANKPYAASDGVFHTMERHGLGNGIFHVMIEVRNDLIALPEQISPLATQLSDLIKQAAEIVAPVKKDISA